MPTRVPPPRRTTPRALARNAVRIVAFAGLAVGIGTTPPAVHAATLLTTLGFEDDVDLVAAPSREFLVIPEESASGNAARLTIVDLDPTTGAPLNAAAPTVIANLLGFENGVDPIIFSGGTQPLVFVPLEKQDGSNAELMILQVDATTGALLDRVDIPLGDLGFMPDVDGVLSDYPEAVAFFALQSEDGSERGVLVVDAGDVPDGDWGACRLLSTDGRAACGANDQVDLPHLAVGIDPVAYRTCCSVRLALPVRYADHGDLLLLDFESDLIAGDLPPEWHGNRDSVRDLNAATARPTNFPGWEEDVDIALLPAGTCGIPNRSILVPVEAETVAAGDVADVYLLDDNGVAQWTFSHDNGLPARPLPGFERGVDLVRLCPAGGGDPLLLIPWENDAATDAGLYAVNPATGAVVYDLEALNPPLVVTGYEVGVEPVVWDTAVVVPMENGGGLGALCSFDAATGIVAGVLSLGTIAPGGFGFAPSVDPIVATATVNGAPVHRLYVPITRDANGDANVLFSRTPPTLEPLTVETLNSINFGGLQTDVDIGVVDKTALGGAFVALPEEKPDGSDARVRWEDVPSIGPHVAIAVGRTTIPSSLFFVHAADAQLVRRVDNLFGLATGLDMATGRGSVEMANPPDSYQAANVATDNDTDPTLVWRATPTGVGALPGVGDPSARSVVAWIAHANPFVPGGAVRFALSAPARVSVDVLDVRGRRVRRLFTGDATAGEHAVAWDARDGAGRSVAAGVYRVRVSTTAGALAQGLVVTR